MTGGIGFLMLALFSFSLMGIVHKLGDRVGANPVWVASLTMGLASGIAALRSVIGAGLNTAPTSVFLIALPFGLCAAIALWTFQWAVRHGRIATSWLRSDRTRSGLYGEVSLTKSRPVAHCRRCRRAVGSESTHQFSSRRSDVVPTDAGGSSTASGLRPAS
jgi:hypothetical protein